MHRLVGIGEATVFTGFCAEHDASLFKPIDQAELVPTREQCFLLHYRAVCRELYVKRTSVPINQLLRDADRGAPIHVQRMVQDLVQDRNHSIQTALNELEDHKGVCDRAIRSANLAKFRAFSLAFAAVPALACSGLTQPIYDFSGKILQDISDFSSPLRQLSFTVLPTDFGGVAVLGWLKEAETACGLFVSSFLALPDDRKSDAIVQLIFDSFENHAVQPDWWETMPDGHKEEVQLRMLNWTGPSPINTRALMPGITRFADWKPERSKWL